MASEGGPAHTVWFVKRGTVVLSRTGADGVERARVVHGPGTFVGLEALVQPTYADSVRTAGPAILCGIGRAGLDTWLGPRGTPARMALERTLLADASQRPRAAAADGTALQRVARWLLDEHDERHQVPRKVTAALLGIVPETLSRMLAGLRDEGAIELSRRTVTVRDRRLLELRAAGRDGHAEADDEQADAASGEQADAGADAVSPNARSKSTSSSM